MDFNHILIFAAGLWIGSRLPKAWEQLKGGITMIATKINDEKKQKEKVVP